MEVIVVWGWAGIGVGGSVQMEAGVEEGKMWRAVLACLAWTSEVGTLHWLFIRE